MNDSMKTHQLTLILMLTAIMFVACKEQSDFSGGAQDTASNGSSSGDDGIGGLDGVDPSGIGGLGGVDSADGGPGVGGIGGIGNPDFPTGDPNKPDSNLVNIDGTASVPLDESVGTDTLTQGISFDPGKGKTTEGLTLDNTQSVVFALDITGSMSPNIDGLQEGVVRFAQKLFQSGYKVKVGLITFKDAVINRFNLTDDLAAFKSNVDKLVAIDGQNVNEASLSATNAAFDMLVSQASPADVKSIVVITDNPGHFTNDSNPNCDITQTVSKFNNLSAAQQKLMKIFYSVSSLTSVTGPKTSRGQPTIRSCGPLNSNEKYESAQFQFNDILNKSLTSVTPVLKRGGPLDYPFSGDVVIDDFVNKLNEATPKAEEVCIAQKADLFINNKLVSTWPEAGYDLKDSYDLYKNASKIRWLNPVTGADIVPGPGAKVKVFRCCYKKEDAEKGLFDKSCPRGGDQQDVDFTIN